MTRALKYFFYLALFTGVMSSCKKQDFRMGALTAPSDVVINTTIIGQDANHPDGDGSGDVKIELSGKNVLAYYIDFDASNGVSPELITSGQVTHKYTNVGVHTYRITVVAYGKGATATTVTKDIQLRSDFTPDAELVSDLVGDGSKTWSVNKDVPAHFGVGPWSASSTTPEWWSAAPSEKADCCNCFYTASFTFKKDAATGTYSLVVSSPDGAFTKTGALAGGLPGIPGSGAEGCYSYGGGTSSFSFVPSSSGIAASAPSTKTAILLSGNNTYIGYGAVQKEYEILSINETTLKLRVRGTETGNAWYLTLKAD
jgi:Tfp pilus assembly protein PilX